jgi:hypothetical protein
MPGPVNQGWTQLKGKTPSSYSQLLVYDQPGNVHREACKPSKPSCKKRFRERREEEEVTSGSVSEPWVRPIKLVRDDPPEDTFVPPETAFDADGADDATATTGGCFAFRDLTRGSRTCG